MPSAKDITISCGPYTIKQLSRQPTPLELYPRTFVLSNLITWSLWLAYLLCLLDYAHSVEAAGTEPTWPVWVIVLAEFCLSFQDFLLAVSALYAILYSGRSGNRPKYELVGDLAPSVDVFVPCCGEAANVVMDTARAAMAQDYPRQKLRVFVLDDANDGSLREAVLELAKEHRESQGPRLYHLSREIKPGGKSYFKAGNLRFGVEASLRAGGSELIASLDADMISSANWLRSLVPHLILDDDLAMMGASQVWKTTQYRIPNEMF